MKCAILILTYNGLDHLRVCVPSALAAARRAETQAQVVVVDNRSSDDTVAWLRRHYNEVEVIVAKRNDYLFSLNDVVAGRTEDVVVILNNDMRFRDDFLSAMLPHFQSSDVFAVMAGVLDWDGNVVTTGQRLGLIRHGWFYRLPAPADERCFTLDAGGGCSAYRRDFFVQLGGFDSLYRPAYWEDTDISYRAWRRGWKVLYEPRSIVYHRISATLSEMKGGEGGLNRLMDRNALLFQLRCVGGWGFVAVHLFALPIRIGRRLLRGNTQLLRALVSASPRMIAALRRRWTEQHLWIRPERDFLAEIHATRQAK